MTERIRFYFDVLSPYSYLCHQFLKRYVPEWSKSHLITLEYYPVLIAGIMKSSGNIPPGSNQFKREYLLKDMKRTCEIHGITMNTRVLDTLFPIKTLEVQRILTAAKNDFQLANPSVYHRLIDCIWVPMIVPFVNSI
jgi:2-hydroxychromene-2-carboxylate isomerase